MRRAVGLLRPVWPAVGWISGGMRRAVGVLRGRRSLPGGWISGRMRRASELVSWAGVACWPVGSPAGCGVPSSWCAPRRPRRWWGSCSMIATFAATPPPGGGVRNLFEKDFFRCGFPRRRGFAHGPLKNPVLLSRPFSSGGLACRRAPGSSSGFVNNRQRRKCICQAGGVTTPPRHHNATSGALMK